MACMRGGCCGRGGAAHQQAWRACGRVHVCGRWVNARVWEVQSCTCIVYVHEVHVGRQAAGGGREGGRCGPPGRAPRRHYCMSTVLHITVRSSRAAHAFAFSRRLPQAPRALQSYYCVEEHPLSTAPRVAHATQPAQYLLPTTLGGSPAAGGPVATAPCLPPPAWHLTSHHHRLPCISHWRQDLGPRREKAHMPCHAMMPAEHAHETAMPSIYTIGSRPFTPLQSWPPRCCRVAPDQCLWDQPNHAPPPTPLSY